MENQNQQEVVPDQQNNVISGSMIPAEPNDAQISQQKPKKRHVRTGFIVIVLSFILIPSGLVGGFIAKCKISQNNVKNNSKLEITQFEKVKLTSTDSVAPTVYLGGDCVDSKPYVQVDKKVPNNKTAPELIAELRTTLSPQNYTLSDEKVVGGSCGPSYSAQVLGNGIEFSVTVKAYKSDASNDFLCNSGSIVNESALINKPAPFIYAKLKT